MLYGTMRGEVLHRDAGEPRGGSIFFVAITASLPDIVPIESQKHYYETVIQRLRRFPKDWEITVFSEFYFLSGIKSRLHVKEQISIDVIPNLEE